MFSAQAETGEKPQEEMRPEQEGEVGEETEEMGSEKMPDEEDAQEKETVIEQEVVDELVAEEQNDAGAQTEQPRPPAVDTVPEPEPDDTAVPDATTPPTETEQPPG